MFVARLKKKIFTIGVVVLSAMQVVVMADTAISDSQPNEPSKIRYIKEINVTEIKLSNGMKVLIKPTDFEPDEVFVQLVAPGGYSSLNKDQRPSGVLAGKIAVESGLGTYSANELTYILYRDTIDLNVSIEKTHRMVDVNSRPESLESVFRIIGLIFKENRLDQKALESVVERERESIRNRHVDPEQSFEVMYFALNTENSKTLKPLSLKALKRVDLEKSKEFYKSSFTNPSEFTLSIVGDVDPNKVKLLIDKYLAILQDDPAVKGPTYPKPPSFPEGVTRRIVPMRHQTDAYARITIPLRISLSTENIEVFDVANLLIEKKLRDVIREETGKTYGVDVGYELPMYPYPDRVWLTIQYHSPKDKVQKIEKLIMNEVRKLRKQEVDQEEFASVVKHQKNSEEFWYKDDCFWQAKLANYSLWNWDVATISPKPSEAYDQLKPKDVTVFLDDAITCDNYTLITSVP
jgi:predicted Zn-dependent peptidase